MLFCVYFPRKAGGRCGFAESIPQERITALKTDQTSVEMTGVGETVSSIVQTAEAPPQKYPQLMLNETREEEEKKVYLVSLLNPFRQGTIPIVASTRCWTGRGGDAQHLGRGGGRGW